RIQCRAGGAARRVAVAAAGTCNGAGYRCRVGTADLARPRYGTRGQPARQTGAGATRRPPRRSGVSGRGGGPAGASRRDRRSGAGRLSDGCPAVHRVCAGWAVQHVGFVRAAWCLQEIARPGYGVVRAAAVAAWGPSSSSVRNPASSSTGTPSCTAFSYLEPGAYPATTNAVFFETDPAARPPRAMIASFASSREMVGNDPVTTMDKPTRLRGTDSSWSAAMRTPARRH